MKNAFDVFDHIHTKISVSSVFYAHLNVKF